MTVRLHRLQKLKEKFTGLQSQVSGVGKGLPTVLQNIATIMGTPSQNIMQTTLGTPHPLV
jgi:DNA anti-recombination protein RmuC